MKRNITTILFCFIAATFVAQGQEKDKDEEKKSRSTSISDIDDKDAAQKVKTADNLLNQRSYYNAIDLYEQALEKAPRNEYIMYKLGKTYFEARDYKNSDKYFEKYMERQTDITASEHPEAWYYHGQCLKHLGEYEKAKRTFINFYRNRKLRGKEVEYFKDLAKNEFRSCAYAQREVQEDTAYIEVQFPEGDINHAYTEFSPHPLSEDELMFASIRSDSIIQYDYHDEKIFPVHLYTSKKKDGVWSEAKPLSDEINTSLDHNANATISPDGSQLFFTRCHVDHHSGVICDIFVAEKKGDKWGDAHKLHNRINTLTSSSTQPTFGVMRKRRRGRISKVPVLYFASDRTGGYGGFDIWYSEMDDKGRFSHPENCGKRLNTPGNEISPYYDSDNNQMFLSSDYHHGFGGYDIFVAGGSGDRFRKPRNMGLPVNTSYDDTFYTPLRVSKDDTLQKGFLVSNRPGGIALKSETCCDDIYYFEEYEPEKMEVKGKVEEKLFSHFVVPDSMRSSIDDSTLTALEDSIVNTEIKNIEGAKIGFVKKRFAMDEEGQKLSAQTDQYEDRIMWGDTTNESGTFDERRLIKGKQYAMVIKTPDNGIQVVDLDSVMQHTSGDSALVQVAKDVKDTSQTEEDLVEFRKSFSMDIKKEDIKKDTKFVLDNIYFEFDKAELKEESLPTLETLVMFMEKHEDVIIEVSGHTDSRGDDEYNKELSQKRAESVGKYIVKQGIRKNRIIPKGYGETDPIAPNKKEDGSDNPEGRKKNRRTEVKILKVK